MRIGLNIINTYAYPFSRSYSATNAPCASTGQAPIASIILKPVSLNSTDKETRRRARAEKMLARAERRLRQAANLVDKWKLQLTELDRAGIDAKQANLWPEEDPDHETTTDALVP
jgi:hypothetical protein